MLDETRSQCLERWMAQYGSVILRTCFVCLGSMSMAEDASQDTFIKAWSAMDRFKGQTERSERAWLVTIAMNTCRDYHRSAWFRHVDMRKALEDLPPGNQPTTQEDRTLFLDIMRLPVKYRQTLLLHSYHGFSMREIADILGISASTVHSRLKKAQACMRRVLEGGGVHA